MKTSTFTAAAAIFSTSYAATVTLETTPCLNPSIALQQFDIELNTSGPVAKYLPSVCGLRILSASPGIDINTITCQAFRDVAGTQPGSALFTYAEPALIATNPVQEQAILCTYPTISTGKFRRQDNGTASTSNSVVSASSTVTLPVSSAESSFTTTQIVTASSGMPSSSGNLTTPSTTLRPSASQVTEAPRESTGAASPASVGMGVVVAAIAAMLA